jgi:dienelactone hydrolase
MSHALRTELIEYDDGDTVCEGWAAWQDRPGGPRPCVLVAHDWSGQNQGIRAVTERVARLGWVAFALDAYGKGVRGEETGDNTHLMTPMLADRALLRRRLLAGLAAAKRHPAVDPRRVAAIGYCFGGLCVLDLARAVAPDLLGVASFHGVFQPPGLGEQPPIAAKVLLLHGWDDPLAPPDAVLAIARELTDAKADWQLHAYGHALHAFTFQGAYMPERGIAYDAAADRRSWAALQGFLAELFGS